MDAPVITPDVAVFRVDSDHLAPTAEECRIVWGSDRGMWCAYDENGLTAHADDREHAALKLFAKRRHMKRLPQSIVRTPEQRKDWTVGLGILALIGMMAIFFDGVLAVIHQLV